MDRDHESLMIQEMYDEVNKAMNEDLTLLEKHINIIRHSIDDRSRNSIKDLELHSNKKVTAKLELSRNVCQRVKDELAKIEELLQEYRVKIKVDVSMEAKERLKPTSYISSSKLKQSYKLCNDEMTASSSREPQTFASPSGTWKNILESKLEPTENILTRPRELPPSEFDQSDLKFKQELTELRRKVYAVPKDNAKFRTESEYNKSTGVPDRRSTRASVKDFIQNTQKHRDSITLPSIEEESKKIGVLKFIDGCSKECEIWRKLLDAHRNQLRSKWYLVLCPQIEKLLKKRRIPVVHLLPSKTFDFLSSIQENGINFTLVKEDLFPLLENPSEAGPWLRGWKPQFKTIEGKDLAAIMIQKHWRGYAIRKKIHESECKYIAASIIWFSWMVVKKNRLLQQHYLETMLVMLGVTRELHRKLSSDYNNVIDLPHVVIHLPSLSYPIDIRRTIPSSDFAIYQNTMSLRMSFLQNPKAEVIYILPIKPTENLLTMYYDLIESVCPDENVQKRMTFLELSERKTLEIRSFNTARILHCSYDTVNAIKSKVGEKSAYFLPWILDECDIRVAGNFGIPLLSPDIELQRNLLNKSYIANLISDLELEQPAHVANVKDYVTLCRKLAELICFNTEVCLWLIKLNVGMAEMQTGIFLINHISIPFMPILRKDKDTHGDKWKHSPDLHTDFLNCLIEHLPTVVSTVTRLSLGYKSWKEFYAHLTKYGCLLQAIPNEKLASSVTVTLFIPGKSTGQSPEWTGTADQIQLEPPYYDFGYMIPQTSVDNDQLKPTVTKLAEALQDKGYFGYLSVNLHCYPHKREDKTIVLVIDVDPHYSHAQHFIDWVKFAIKGTYNYSINTFEVGPNVLPEVPKRKDSMITSMKKIANKNEINERYAVGIRKLYHSSLTFYQWAKLKTIAEECGIKYDAVIKQGSHLILHDDDKKNCAMMTTISPDMKTTLSMVEASLKKLSRALTTKSKKKPKTNINAAALLFTELSLNYQSITVDECIEYNKLK